MSLTRLFNFIIAEDRIPESAKVRISRTQEKSLLFLFFLFIYIYLFGFIRKEVRKKILILHASVRLSWLAEKELFFRAHQTDQTFDWLNEKKFADFKIHFCVERLFRILRVELEVRELEVFSYFSLTFVALIYSSSSSRTGCCYKGIELLLKSFILQKI